MAILLSIAMFVMGIIVSYMNFGYAPFLAIVVSLAAAVTIYTMFKAIEKMFS